MEGIEFIRHLDAVLACVIRVQAHPPSTSFITQPSANMQAGFIVYPSGGHVEAHLHLPLERRVVGTAEFIQVRSGHCSVDVYDHQRKRVATVDLAVGDAILTLEGGHGITMYEDTVLLELKQGPFFEGLDKERFTPTENLPLP